MGETPIESEAEDSSKEKSPSHKEFEKIDLSDLNNIPEEIESLLENLPNEEQKIVVRALIATSVRRSWDGPIPPPDVLKQYNDCFDGGAKAIFDMAKDQSQHRMELEKIAVNRELNQSGRGQIFGFIIAILFLAASVFLGYYGHEILAGTIATIDLVALVVAFVAGKNNIRLDISRKAKSEKELPEKKETDLEKK